MGVRGAGVQRQFAQVPLNPLSSASNSASLKTSESRNRRSSSGDVVRVLKPMPVVVAVCTPAAASHGNWTAEYSPARIAEVHQWRTRYGGECATIVFEFGAERSARTFRQLVAMCVQLQIHAAGQRCLRLRRRHEAEHVVLVHDREVDVQYTAQRLEQRLPVSGSQTIGVRAEAITGRCARRFLGQRENT